MDAQVALFSLVPGVLLLVVSEIRSQLCRYRDSERIRELESGVMSWSMRALDAERELRSLTGPDVDEEEDEEWMENGG